MDRRHRHEGGKTSGKRQDRRGHRYPRRRGHSERFSGLARRRDSRKRIRHRVARSGKDVDASGPGREAEEAPLARQPKSRHVSLPSRRREGGMPTGKSDRLDRQLQLKLLELMRLLPAAETITVHASFPKN